MLETCRDFSGRFFVGDFCLAFTAVDQQSTCKISGYAV